MVSPSNMKVMSTSSVTSTDVRYAVSPEPGNVADSLVSAVAGRDVVVVVGAVVVVVGALVSVVVVVVLVVVGSIAVVAVEFSADVHPKSVRSATSSSAVRRMVSPGERGLRTSLSERRYPRDRSRKRQDRCTWIVII
jgi:hypothetical protein